MEPMELDKRLERIEYNVYWLRQELNFGAIVAGVLLLLILWRAW